MGQGTSRSDKTIQELPEDERYFGFENFGNTCYCNSVLQVLFFCLPFREKVLEYAASLPGRADTKETILTCLAELFAQISAQRKKSGYLSPRKFVARVKAENELFSSYMHQDAHEFFNYLLNDMGETLAKESRVAAASARSRDAHSTADSRGSPLKLMRLPAKAAPGGTTSSSSMHVRTPSLQALHEMQQRSEGGASLRPVRTWLDELFQGRLVSETRCLRCEAVTSREEPFYDLSLEIDQNSSVTSCLGRFSATETLDGADKFSCDSCGCKQEAQKRMRVGALPPVLCLHLKRFKYMEQLGQMKKLTHRVLFPFELKLGNVATNDCPDADAEYDLCAVVVHMGAHVNHGHYVALVKSHGRWVCFNDEGVHLVSESQVQSTFGHTQEPQMRADGAGTAHVDHAYILVYQRLPPSGQQQQSAAANGDEPADEQPVEAPSQQQQQQQQQQQRQHFGVALDRGGIEAI